MLLKQKQKSGQTEKNVKVKLGLIEKKWDTWKKLLPYMVNKTYITCGDKHILTCCIVFHPLFSC